MTRRHIVVLGAQPEWLSGLRGPMIRDFLARGHRVTAIGAEEMVDVRAALEGWGADYVVVPIRRAGLNPIADLKAVRALYAALKRLKPDMVFAYTIKPVVYGMPVAWAAGVRERYAMIPGRGYALQPGKERARRIARTAAAAMYRAGLRFASGALFHNEADRALFRARGWLPAATPANRIWGSGVDLEYHHPAPLPDEPIAFLMIGRLIADKGVHEYVAAARIMKARHPEAVFRLAGPTDPSPNGVSAATVAGWAAEGAIDYLGPLKDVRPAIHGCHVLVLPSYGEGLPRSVLEAMAAGRGIVTTDAPGCPDTVIEGVSGFVVPARDASALAEAMAKFVADPALVRSAGAASLAFARERFDVTKINAEIAAFIGLAAAPAPLEAQAA